MSTGKDYRDNLPTVSYGKSYKANGDDSNNVKSDEANQSKKTEPDGARDQETIAKLPHTFVKISFSDIELGDCCGEGSFGTVYKAKWLSQAGKEVAVKTLNRMDEEVHIISVLSHRNIIQFYGACADKPNFCLVTEYAPYGSLYSFLSSPKSGDLEFSMMLSWARDVALGMNYLHDQAPIQVVHRDLKSKNVLICHDFTLKICDFGASRLFDETTVMTTTGTYPWMAPELIQGLPTSELCDVYSYGVVLWELLTREIPFKGLQGFQVAWIVVEKHERPLIPTTCPKRFADLMKRCWSADASSRPTFHDLCLELNGMINDGQLEKETDSFVHTKNDWMQEVKSKMKDIHHQESKFEAKKDDFVEREHILQKWAEGLRNELREKSLHNIVHHYSKTRETYNCQFSSEVSGDVDVDTVKNVMDHFMSKSGMPGKSKEDMEKKMDNFQASHSPTSVIGMPLSRQGSSSSMESSRSLSLHSDMNYDMSKVNINTSPTGYFEPSDGIGYPKSKDQSKSMNRSHTKLQKQVSSSSEEFQYEKLSCGANGGESPLNGGKGINMWESKAKFKDSQEKYFSENESVKMFDASPSSPEVKDNKLAFSAGVIEEALKRMKLNGHDFDLTPNFATQLSKFIQSVTKEKCDPSLTQMEGQGDNVNTLGNQATNDTGGIPPPGVKRQSSISDKSLSYKRNMSSFAKKEQSSKVHQTNKKDCAAIIARNLSKLDNSVKPKTLNKNAVTQTESSPRENVQEKSTQTHGEDSIGDNSKYKRKILFHCLKKPCMIEVCHDVLQSDASENIQFNHKRLLRNSSLESEGQRSSNGTRHQYPGPSSITTQSINNHRQRPNLSLNLGRSMNGGPKRRVTVTGSPLFDSARNRLLCDDPHDRSPTNISPTKMRFQNAIDISEGRRSVFETDDFTYIIRPNMPR